MIASDQKIREVRERCGESIEEILAKESEFDLYQILGAIEVLVSSKIYQKLNTSLAERMVFAFVWLAREVQNGGFHQYFSNSAGDFWKDVLNGLGAIGDEDGKRQFEHVLSIFPGSSLSEDRETRNVQLDELEERDKPNTLERFEEVDSAYAIRPFPRWELILNYVKAHPDEFDLKKA